MNYCLWGHESAKDNEYKGSCFSEHAYLRDILVQDIGENSINVPQVKEVLPGDVKLLLVMFPECQLVPIDIRLGSRLRGLGLTV